jgi:phage terminase large subunit
MTLQQKINKLDLLQIRVELFKRGQFDFICMQDGIKHTKQEQALQILTDNITREFSYGGAAGGAKSWTGAAWIALMCIAFPGTRWFAGRLELKQLRDSTYHTFLKVFKKYGIKQGRDCKYNGQDNYFTFTNGSQIDFIELKYYPRDPYFERFGSKEYTGGWIEEGGEVPFAAFDTLKTRVNRHLNDVYKIVGKIFITLNPKKNWVYTYFWKPFKDGSLPPSVKFLQAFVQDNPFIDTGYIDQLKSIKDKIKKERLLFGNFDYEDDANALMMRDAIEDLFNAAYIKPVGNKYITGDIARFGKDSTVIYVWHGWLIIERHVLLKNSITQVAAFIKQLSVKHEVPMSQIVVDEDGVGGGIVDVLRCKGFVNNSTALENPKTKEKDNYKNLKTQCSYMAAEVVNKHETGFAACFFDSEELKEKFIEEAEQVKRKDPDSDGKLEIIPKEVVKELIGRSPDDWDCFMMRQIFELKPKRKLVYSY